MLPQVPQYVWPQLGIARCRWVRRRTAADGSNGVGGHAVGPDGRPAVLHPNSTSDTRDMEFAGFMTLPGLVLLLTGIALVDQLLLRAGRAGVLPRRNGARAGQVSSAARVA